MATSPTDAAGTYDLTVGGSPTSRTANSITKYNEGYGLDGSSDYLTHTSNDFAFEGAVAGFIAFEIDSLTSRQALISISEDDSNRHYFYLFVESDGTVNYNATGQSASTTTGTIGTGEFTATVRLDGSGNLRIKVWNSSGTVVVNETFTRSFPANDDTATVFLGAQSDISNNPINNLDGAIYECRLWSSTIPAQADLDILADPNNTTGGSNGDGYKDSLIGSEFAAWFMSDQDGPSDRTAPSAPTGLNARTVSTTQIDLDWDDNSESDLSHYKVKRSTTNGGPYTVIDSNVSSSSYSDTTVSSDTTYYYVVSAVDTSDNESTNSAEDSATTSFTTRSSTITQKFSVNSPGDNTQNSIITQKFSVDNPNDSPETLVVSQKFSLNNPGENTLTDTWTQKFSTKTADPNTSHSDTWTQKFATDEPTPDVTYSDSWTKKFSVFTDIYFSSSDSFTQKFTTHIPQPLDPQQFTMKTSLLDNPEDTPNDQSFTQQFGVLDNPELSTHSNTFTTKFSVLGFIPPDQLVHRRELTKTHGRSSSRKPKYYNTGLTYEN